MTDMKELRFPDPAPDRKIAAALKPFLTPPSDTPAYWDGLQRRVMARVANAAALPTWWSVSPGVARVGLVAAGLAILALGALALQTRELEMRVAYEAVTETELEVARIIPGIDEPYVAPRAQTPQR
jgi:hypothetical protein